MSQSVRCPSCGDVRESDEAIPPFATVECASCGTEWTPITNLSKEDGRKLTYPRTIGIAGIAWLITGGWFALLSANVGWSMYEVGSNDKTLVVGLMLLGYAIFAVGFIQVGIQSLRGTARDMLGNGIGSIILGRWDLPSPL